MDEKTLAQEIAAFFYQPPTPSKEDGWFTISDVAMITQRTEYSIQKECKDRYASGELERTAIGCHVWYRIKKDA